MHKVWVTGIGILSALGSGQKSHCSAMADSKTGLSKHTLFNGVSPDPCICGIIPSKYIKQNIDKSAHNRANLILEHTFKQVLRSADIAVPLSADLILGTTLGNMHGGTKYYQNLHKNIKPEKTLLHHFLPCAPVEYLAEKYSVTGRVQTVASACGSASAAIGQAFHRIRSGASQRVITGGFDVLSPFVVAGFNSLQLISKNECKPFDINRDGLNPGEGAALLFLESEESARKRDARPLAEISGFGDALDACYFTRAHPEGKGLIVAIKKAMNLARVMKDKIDYIHLHGTATLINDTSEYIACNKIFDKCLQEIPACSTKPMTGHTFGASGAINAVISVISLQNSIVPATLFHETLDSAMPRLCILKKPKIIYGIQHVLSLSLGIGGEAFALIVTRINN